MASLHELDTYEVSEPYQTNSRNELHAATSEKQKPDQAGCSRWIIGCAIIMAFIALCVSVATLILLYTTGMFTSTGLKADQFDMPTNKPGLTTDATDAKATSIPQMITEKAPPTSRPTEASHDENQSGGSTYVRWGRTVCPETSSLVYAGMVAGEYYLHTGGGSNFVCLPYDPDYLQVQVGEQSRATVYPTEYELAGFPPLSHLQDHEVPCAVCRVIRRGTMLMIPAKIVCPSDWTEEYQGYLMTEHYGHKSSKDYICVDENAEARPDSNPANQNGALLYTVEGRCAIGNLPCRPYITGDELTCVVCTI